MTAKTPSSFVPKLRFPEFRNAPAWESRSLGDLGVFIRGLTYTAGDVAEAGLLVLRSSNIQGGRLVLDSDLVHVAKECPPDLLLNEGDIAICMSNGSKALVGKSAEYRGGYEGDVTVGAFCSIFRASIDFARLAFATEQYSVFVALGIAGGNINNLKNSDLEAFKFRVPRIRKEQQKIVDCLSSLDDLITAEGRKLDALRRHKQGLVQQLFPQPGETVPRLRFPEFHNGTEWQERRAGSLFANRVAKGEEGLPIYSVTMYDGMVQRDTLDRNFHDIENAASNKKACKGDIAYNMMRMWQGALGVAIEDCLVSPAYIVLAPQKDVDSHFFAYLFKLPSSLQLLTSHSRGLTKDRLRLYYDDFARIPLRCPECVEQQRIADCLASLDASIAAEAEYLAALRRHERGLLQQLFPAPEEESQ